MAGLTGGRAITVYGQNEVVKDLIAARDATGRPLHFEATRVAVHDIASVISAPHVPLGRPDHEVACDIIAGCDGSHGICRPKIPAVRSAATVRA